MVKYVVKTRFASLPSTVNKAPWMITVTGPYGTLLKVGTLIPGKKHGSIAEILHRNVDMVSARAERVIIRARRSSTSLFSVIERRPRKRAFEKIDESHR